MKIRRGQGGSDGWSAVSCSAMSPSAPATAQPGDAQPLADGWVVVVKSDCPTCSLVAGALQRLQRAPEPLQVVAQDHPIGFLDELGIPTALDHELLLSHRLEVDTVPTLLVRRGGDSVGRAVGWNRAEWRRLTGIEDLGEGLPEQRPGCGALNLQSPHAERLALLDRGGPPARSGEIGDEEDPIEACFRRGWSDGLPVVPPTAERVQRMLGGTRRDPAEVLARVAPDYGVCTVEKAAINAVMAGCLPEYLPIVLTAIEAACSEPFNWHGLAATTYFSGPVVVVNGPVASRIGMNSGVNALGQGNRANSTIGRALQLTLRNVGGVVPGGIDRATLGNPGKLSLCFTENEDWRDDPAAWGSLAAERGVEAGRSAVTLFAGEGPRGIVDQLSRTPESLAWSLAAGLRSVAHPKLVLGFDALLVLSPEHCRVIDQAGWSRARLRGELLERLQLPLAEIERGAGGCAEGVAKDRLPDPAPEKLPKLRPDALLLARAGGGAGLFSAVLGGWVGGSTGSIPVTRAVEELG